MAGSALILVMDKSHETTPDERPIAVEVIEAPDGVLNIIIRTGQQPDVELEELRSKPRRAPKWVH